MYKVVENIFPTIMPAKISLKTSTFNVENNSTHWGIQQKSGELKRFIRLKKNKRAGILLSYRI